MFPTQFLLYIYPNFVGCDVMESLTFDRMTLMVKPDIIIFTHVLCY